MKEISIKIPAELESEFRTISEIELSIIINKLLKNELSKIIRFKQIVSKSQLTEEKAEKLADEISISLTKRYEKMFSEK